MAWDTNYKSYRIALSNGNRTATTDGTANWQSVRGWPSSYEGKHYWELLLPAGSVSTTLCVGFASAAFDASGTGTVGKTAGSGVCLEVNSQTLYLDGASMGYTSQTFAAGDIVGLGLTHESGNTWTFRVYKNGNPTGNISNFTLRPLWPCLSNNEAVVRAFACNFASADMAYKAFIRSTFSLDYEQWDIDTTYGRVLVEYGHDQRGLSGVSPGIIACDGYNYKYITAMGAVNKALLIDAAGNIMFGDAPGTPASQAEVDAATDAIKAVTPSTTLHLDKVYVPINAATEALAAGDFVNIYNASGYLRCRKASATDATKPAHGFVKTAVANGNFAEVYIAGNNDVLSGMTVGAMQYLSTTGGGRTETPPVAAGNMIQPLGIARSATTMRFDYVRPIVAGTGITLTETAATGVLTIAASGGASAKAIVFNATAASLSTTTDGATIYFGAMAGLAPQTTAALARIYVPVACTIIRADIQWRAATAGTGESFTMYIRKNNATDTSIAAVASTSATKYFSNAALNIAMAAGDYFEIKCICPTWATNPATVAVSGQIYAE